MVRESAPDELEWFDPLYQRGGQRFVWEDGIHVIKRVDPIHNGISYTLKCGVMFTFVAPAGPILEAKIKLPKPTCPLCLTRLQRPHSH